MHEHPVAIFFLLAFGLTWGCILLVAGSGGLPMTPEAFAESEAMVYAAMLAGPSIAGLVLTGLVDGRAGYRELFSRLLHWRVGWGWYALAVLTAPVLATGTLALLSRFDPAFAPSIFASSEGAGLLLTGIAAGLAVGLFEEIGWTGFAVPRMLERRGYLAVGIGTGLLWGAWHFPPFWEADSFAGALPFAILVARLFLWLPAYRVLMVWAYARTRSLLLVILMHASLVAATLVLPPMELAGAQLLTWLLAWTVVLWLPAIWLGMRQRGRLAPER